MKVVAQLRKNHSLFDMVLDQGLSLSNEAHQSTAACQYTIDGLWGLRSYTTPSVSGTTSVHAALECAIICTVLTTHGCSVAI